MSHINSVTQSDRNAMDSGTVWISLMNGTAQVSYKLMMYSEVTGLVKIIYPNKIIQSETTPISQFRTIIS